MWRVVNLKPVEWWQCPTARLINVVTLVNEGRYDLIVLSNAETYGIILKTKSFRTGLYEFCTTTIPLQESVETFVNTYRVSIN